MNPIEIGNKKRDSRLSAGLGNPTRLVASIGLSPDNSDPRTEVEKAHAAANAGADIINDDSIAEPMGTDLLAQLLDEIALPINTEPIFDTVATAALRSDYLDFTVPEVVSTVEKHARMGIDIVTIHFAYSFRLAEMASTSNRVIPTTSRGGALITAYMSRTGKENPYREAISEIFDIIASYGVTLSLGTVLRPGSVVDGLDNLFIDELSSQIEIIEQAKERKIPVMVEGPGHVPYSSIKACIEKMKTTTGGLPVRLLGPTPCDCGTGHDHVVGAVGAVFAIMAGCDFLTCTPRSEHLGLPAVKDVEEAIKTYRLVSYILQDGPNQNFKRDHILSAARSECDWETIWKQSLFPEDGAELFRLRSSRTKGPCTVCGRYCPLVIGNSHLERIRDDARG